MNKQIIELSENLDGEIEQFLRGLHHDKFLWMKDLIFEAFSDLKKQLNKKGGDEREIVKKFILQFRQENEKKIREILEYSKKLFQDRAFESLNLLAEEMEFDLSENSLSLIAVPTILPYSPFCGNTFYFSILGDIYRFKKGQEGLLTAIHEISHMILFKIIEANKIKISDWTIIHYLKEILASVLLNQKDLAKTLDVKNYLGNEDLHQIYVLDLRNEKKQICLFFAEIYNKLRKDNDRGFLKTLSVMIEILASMRNDLEIRHKLWNFRNTKIKVDKKIVDAYRKPILINKSVLRGIE